jgi:hypothetical protein
LHAEHGIGGEPPLLEHLAQLIADHPTGPTTRPANAIPSADPVIRTRSCATRRKVF